MVRVATALVFARVLLLILAACAFKLAWRLVDAGGILCRLPVFFRSTRGLENVSSPTQMARVA
jgi:hypothetical protein